MKLPAKQKPIIHAQGCHLWTKSKTAIYGCILSLNDTKVHSYCSVHNMLIFLHLIAQPIDT